MITLELLKERAPGSVISQITGQVKNVWDPKTGTSSKGPWSFQDIVLIDSNGEEMKVSVQHPNMPPVPKSLIGKTVEITAKQGERGYTGVYVEDNENKKTGEVIRRIKVTPTGSIKEVGEESSYSQALGKPISSSTKKPVDLSILDARFRACYMVAFDTAKKLRQQLAQEGFDVPDENFLSLVATALINMERDGLKNAVSLKPAAALEEDEIPF
jgi:hypothetical protein